MEKNSEDYVVGTGEDGRPVTKKGYVWKEGRVERPDTDILYYDLDSLSLTWTERVDGRDILYGWNKDMRKYRWNRSVGYAEPS